MSSAATPHDPERMETDEGTRLVDDRRPGGVSRTAASGDGGSVGSGSAAGRGGLPAGRVDSLDAELGARSGRAGLRRDPALASSAAQDRRRENRLVVIQVALCTITGTAMIGGAFAHIGWLFWGIGLPVAIITLVYMFLAVGFIQLWAKERRGV